VLNLFNIVSYNKRLLKHNEFEAVMILKQKKQSQQIQQSMLTKQGRDDKACSHVKIVTGDKIKTGDRVQTPATDKGIIT